MSNTTLATSFLSSFMRARKQKQEKEEADQEKKARLKLIEIELERANRQAQKEDQQKEAQDAFFRAAKNKLGGVITSPLPGTGVELGDVEATMASTAKPPSSLVEMLADPQMALRALQANIPLPAQAEDPLAKLEAFQKRPDLFNLQKELSSASAPRTVVTTDMRQEGAEAQTVGKGFGEQFMKSQEAGLNADGKIARLQRMEQLMEGVRTGKLTPKITQVTAIAESLGIKIDPTLDSKQAIEALTNEMALQLRNPSAGAGMPGQLSDKDREFLMTLPPGLEKTKGGNRLLIETAMKLAQRDKDVARIAREYRKKHGSIDEGLYSELEAFSEANPLFGAVPSVEDVSGMSDEELLQKLLGSGGG